jgi:hypothetical protein
MRNQKRQHREDPTRIEPIRNFTKLYRRPDSANGLHHAKPPMSDKPNRTDATGPLAEGVELAYTVIDKYIAEGRQTAEGLSSGPYRTRIANDNVQDLLERMLRFQAEILPLWIETLATLVTVRPSQTGNSAKQGARPNSNGTKHSNADHMPIEIASPRPVQVLFDLEPNCDRQSLVALGVNSVDPKKPGLTDISFMPGGVQGQMKLLVRIAKDQPSGAYTGVIVDRNSGDLRGTLSIRIAD